MGEFFTKNDRDQLVFYQVPKVLITGEKYADMNPRALKLYIVLLDRMKLSIENNWLDKDGRYYVRMSIEKGSELLRFSEPTFKRMKKELHKYGLLEEVRQGLARTNRLYVKKCDYTDEDVVRINEEVDDLMTELENKASALEPRQTDQKLPVSKDQKLPVSMDQNLPTNKNNFNKNNNINNKENHNLNPIDIYEVLQDTTLPKSIQNKIKVMIASKSIKLTDEKILQIEDAYNHQKARGYIIPNCAPDYPEALNDYEFASTLEKMLKSISLSEVYNMKGMIQTWTKKAYNFKKNEHQPLSFAGKENDKFYNWLEE